MLHLVSKQACKLKLLKRWKIYYVFHWSLLEQNITWKGQVNKKVTELKTGDSGEYKVEAIWDSTIYANKEESHLLDLYYLIAWKRYLEKENIWKPSSTVQHLKKLINSFHNKLLEKLTATFPPTDSAPPMANPTIKLTRPNTKQKRGQPAHNASKQARNWVLDARDIWTIPSL